MASEIYVTVRISRLWPWALRVACVAVCLSVRAFNWLAAHPRVIVR